MKKIILVLAVLMFAATAMAVDPNHITITATVVESDFPVAEVEINYAVTTGKIPRAFALDITVTAGVISSVDGFFSGECDDVNRGYGIFPASFARYIDADDPNWADVNYTPVAEPCDLPGGTLGGIGTSGVTIEMGSLYVDNNSPLLSGTLCSIFVDSDCHVDLALNVGRAGIVMEDGNQPDTITLTETDVTLVCTVPDVVGDTNAVAQAAIVAADFTIGNITTDCNDTIAAGNVISTNPAAGATPGCGTAVDMVVSTGPCVVYYTISGQVASRAAVGEDGVTMSGLPSAPVTSGGGYYSDTAVPAGWNGTVTPAKSGKGFVPKDRVYANVQANQANQDYLVGDASCLRADICSTAYGDPDGLITYEDYVWLTTYYPVQPATVKDCLGDASCLRADICSTSYGAPDGLITYEDYVWLTTYYPVQPATQKDCCP